jgi:2-amino-4-hydroxy-6-hydroxymethyldihydropteridine diphosphokinase
LSELDRAEVSGPLRQPCPDKPRRRLKEKPFRKVYLGIGSNIAPEIHLPRAVELLCDQVRIESISTVWETPPAGLKGQNFLNAALAINTQYSASLLKSLVLRPIEIRLGRVRTANKYAPRTIDLDILVYEERVLDPQIWSQAFLAVPLAELLPDFKNSETQEALQEAARRLAQNLLLTPRSDVLGEAL